MILAIQSVIVFILFLILLLIYRDEWEIRRKIRSIALLEKYWDGRERRRYVRLDTEVEMRYKEIVKKGRSAGGARGVDISDKGMRLLVDKKMENGTLLDLSFAASKASGPIRVLGSVVWCNEAKDKEDLRDKKLFHVGLRITDIREPSRGLFADYIKTLEDGLKKNASKWASPQNQSE
ncbi:PilZ domain-containing protein [Candidatus Omnitrophota bacterium]